MATEDETIRAHLVLPAKLVEEIDERAGTRRRSEFITEDLTKELQRQKRAELAAKMAGALVGPGKHIPEWDTPESTERWLREIRRDRYDPWKDTEDGNGECRDTSSTLPS
jgi:hypothetical protein